MTPKEVQKRKETIENKIDYWEDQLIQLQKDCSHFQLTKTAGADVGNYDPHQDSYWYDYHCHDCGKYWREKC